MVIGLHNLAAKHTNLLTSFRIAHETGYGGIEIGGDKLQRYLAQGFTIESLRPLLQRTPPIGLSYVQDIERQEPDEYQALLAECETICTLAEQLGCPMVQLLTGPLEPTGPYRGLSGRPWPEARRLTAKNLSALAEIGKAHGVRFYLEALTFTPLHTLEQQLEVLGEAGRDNVGLVVDFYHLWGSGTRPEAIARIPKDRIFCVDFCDSADGFGERGDPGQRGRDVWTGAGRIPLKEWVDAVKATGFDGIWRCELLSPKYWELDPWQTARDLKSFLEYLLV
ncbi:MAG TPA: sugar phosphate isomerase/epimerase family protein [Isosphaeraceae bacterium]|nr:sugar phosphate isomerase/epimerase family protein [Isosphaeraceae bacterium]